jgi:hypothetical protein
MKALQKEINIQLVIIFGWIFFFSLNNFINLIAHYKDYISLIFIPAGFKVVIYCLLKWRAFIGIFFGSILTGYYYLDDNHTTHIYTFAFLSGLSPIIAIYIVNLISKLGEKLELLTLSKVMLISFLYALISSFAHNTFLLSINEVNFIQYQQDSIAMFIGDLLGAMIFLSLLSYFRKELIKISLKFL